MADSSVDFMPGLRPANTSRGSHETTAVCPRPLRRLGSGRRIGRRLIVATVAVLIVSTGLVYQVSADTAGDKALRGLANSFAGVMAFPGEIHAAWAARGPSHGLTVGVAMGLGMIVVRELIGPFELVTSPAPWPDKRFGPLLEPAYPWDYFQKGSKTRARSPSKYPAKKGQTQRRR